MAQYPQKFLWQELMQFWKSKTEEVVIECTKILQKMDVLADPGALMNRFLDICNQRRLIVDILLCTPVIKLSMPKLILILQKLVTMESGTITSCLSEDSEQWDCLTQK
jgi:hypothetical protein